MSETSLNAQSCENLGQNSEGEEKTKSSGSVLIVWGNNQNGQLGLGKMISNMTITKPKLCSFREKIIEVSCGVNHSLMLTASRKVLAMGDNLYGQLGFDSSQNPQISEPRAVESLSSKLIVKIAGGSQFSLALSEDNRVYSWGRGDSGQLGNGRMESTHRPQICNRKFIDEKIRLIRVGLARSVLVTKGGEMYCAGDNSQGGLGFGDCSMVMEFTRNRKIDFEIKDIQLGEMHTLYLTNEGRLFASGLNNKGQLGCEKTLVPFSKLPIESDIFSSQTITHIAAGLYSLCVTKTDEMFIWGRK